MFNSFFRSSRIERDLSFLGVDMHSHLLPGLDDGAATIEESLHYFGLMKEWGYRKCILTPHIFNGVYNNSPSSILPVLERMKQELIWAEIDIEIEAAAEYMVDEHFMELLSDDQPLLTIGKNNVLIEMSYAAPSPFIERAIFELNIKGYKPILAHPERYGYYYNNFAQYERLLEMGCIFQCNMLSLSGYYGMPVKKVALKLIKGNFFKLIGTDLHHHNHVDAIKAFTVTKEFYDLANQIPIMNNSL
ncbi:MAG: CpsB/CapC family capsule biosynthesis tyrosine phosphatase [Sphingobacteriia bacterium]|jgi:tyrosine-protein phosphatase YwqE